LNLCEAESVSYLDEVASSPRSLDLAKSVASEVSVCHIMEVGYFSHGPSKLLVKQLVGLVSGG
jgi:hypothetical protein